jgi:hypothetical protein
LLERRFLNVYYGGLTWTECERIPLVYQEWWLERTIKEINKSSEQGDATQSRGTQHNTPDARAMQNRANPNAPPRMRRFT